ncbi:MAG: cytochrome C assembly family protein [Acidiferrobacteraceae bacterium]
MENHLKVAFLYVAPIAMYLALGAIVWSRLAAGRPPMGGAKRKLLMLGVPALCLHAWLLYGDLYQHHGLSLGLTSVTSLVAWAVTFIFLVTMLRKPIENLAVFIMPTAAASILLEWWWPGRSVPTPNTSGWLFAHLVISILAYSLLSIAVVQGLMLAIQEHRLHQKQAGKFLRVLPPMQTMETLMFQMIAVGFALLTLTLVSGIFFSEQIFHRPLVMTHHIVLSLFAWVVFAILLLGRWRFGWRGRNAVRWTLGGFFLLLLAYLGTRFVLEIAFAH